MFAGMNAGLKVSHLSCWRTNQTSLGGAVLPPFLFFNCGFWRIRTNIKEPEGGRVELGGMARPVKQRSEMNKVNKVGVTLLMLLFTLTWVLLFCLKLQLQLLQVSLHLRHVPALLLLLVLLLIQVRPDPRCALHTRRRVTGAPLWFRWGACRCDRVFWCFAFWCFRSLTIFPSTIKQQIINIYNYDCIIWSYLFVSCCYYYIYFFLTNVI